MITATLLFQFVVSAFKSLILLQFQDAAVSSISEAALRSEYEKLGISNRGSARGRDSTNNSLTTNPLVSPVNKRNSNALGLDEEKGPSPMSPGSVPDNAMPSSSSKG